MNIKNKISVLKRNFAKCKNIGGGKKNSKAVYLKINRESEYTFHCVWNWLNIFNELAEYDYYFICDNDRLKKRVLKYVNNIPKDTVWLKSFNNYKIREIASNITVSKEIKWYKAAQAHLTTFFHSEKLGYNSFWNIDADDTLVCLEQLVAAKLIKTIEHQCRNKGFMCYSLDMWKSRSNTWSFGVNYTINDISWTRYMLENCKDKEYKALPKHLNFNLDLFFNYLVNYKNKNIGTFYIENLKFVHYADDMLKRPISSSFSIWKNGTIIYPTIKYWFEIDELGVLPISPEVEKIEFSIEDNACNQFLKNYVHDCVDFRLF